MKIQLCIELDYDDDIWHSDCIEDKLWFYNDILSIEYGKLSLFSNEIGDMIGDVKIINKNISTSTINENAKSYFLGEDNGDN
jgi:hypothetical protein